MARFLLLMAAASLIAAAGATTEAAPAQPPAAAALEVDDECAADDAAACGLSALQIRGQRLAAAGAPAPASQPQPAPQPAQHPQLCAPDIVAETCANVNRLTPEFFGTAADTDVHIVHAAELAEQLMVSRNSILHFLAEHLGVANEETDQQALAKGAFAVNCVELCRRTVLSVPEGRRPPSSDVACYVPEGQTTARCDIDVSHSAFADVFFNSIDSKEGEAMFGEGPNSTEPNRSAGEAPPLEAAPANVDPDSLNYPEKEPDQIAIAISNLFRVYPLIDITVKDLSDENRTEASLGELNSTEAASGEGDRSGQYPFYIPGIPGIPGYTPGYTTPSRRRRMYSGGASASTSGAWKDTVKRVAVKAQAYTAGSLRGVNSGKAQSAMYQWFGTASWSAQQEVRRVLNGVHSLLSNVDYVYPGSRCRSNVFAYVFPNPPNNKNGRGQYIFNLCELYMRSSLQEQIETLVHEGSHHQTMSTDDVCYQGSGSSCKKAYGRRTCQSLARVSPTRALKNADSFCYFVSDSHGTGGSGPAPVPGPAPAPVPQPTSTRRRRSWSPAPPPAQVPYAALPPWLAPFLPPGMGVPSPSPWTLR